MKEDGVSDTASKARIALLIAATGSVAVAALLAAAFLAASLGISMGSATPRINALTVGLVTVPIPALAWIIYLWTRTRPSRFLDIVFRIFVSCGVVLVASYCLFAAMFTMFFVG
jgi:hypothetical protein